MALLDDIKLSLRVTTDALDSEVQGLIDAARFDMGRVGVDPALLELNSDEDLDNAFVKQAVRCYAKAHFGFDNSEAERLDDSYRRIVADLMNSSHNVAAIAQAEESNPFNGMAAAEVWRSLSYRPTKDEYRQACDWLGIEYSPTATNAELRAFLAAACGVEEG